MIFLVTVLYGQHKKYSWTYPPKILRSVTGLPNITRSISGPETTASVQIHMRIACPKRYLYILYLQVLINKLLMYGTSESFILRPILMNFEIFFVKVDRTWDHSTERCERDTDMFVWGKMFNWLGLIDWQHFHTSQIIIDRILLTESAGHYTLHQNSGRLYRAIQKS